MKRKAFTLIELLVIIAIIALLAAILFPVYGRIRERGRKSSCASNMKQLGMAFLQYAQDYDEKLPNVTDGTTGDGGWVKVLSLDNGGRTSKFDVTQGSLFAYTKSASIYDCISDTYDSRLSYTVGTCMAKGSGGFLTGQSLTSFPSASTTLLLGEEDASFSASGYGTSTNDGYGIQCLSGRCGTTRRHIDVGNITYLDGHVKSDNPEDVFNDNIMMGGPSYTSCP